MSWSENHEDRKLLAAAALFGLSDDWVLDGGLSLSRCHWTTAPVHRNAMHVLEGSN